MPHYNLTIITSQSPDTELIHTLKEKYKVLLVDKNKQLRNTIKTEDGYIVIFHEKKKNVEISTEILIKL
jgi:hypothetical protein